MTHEEAIERINQLVRDRALDKETAAVVIDALIKQVPLKVAVKGQGWLRFDACPVCGHEVIGSYCMTCGQSLRWFDNG